MAYKERVWLWDLGLTLGPPPRWNRAYEEPAPSVDRFLERGAYGAWESDDDPYDQGREEFDGARDEGFERRGLLDPTTEDEWGR